MNNKRHHRFQDALRALKHFRAKLEALFNEEGTRPVPPTDEAESAARAELVEVCADVAEMFESYRRSSGREGWMTKRIIEWLEKFPNTWTAKQHDEELKNLHTATESDWDE